MTCAYAEYPLAVQFLRMVSFSKEKPLIGGVAQLGEHLPCKQGVMGSNPIISTSSESCEDDEEPMITRE